MGSIALALNLSVFNQYMSKTFYSSQVYKGQQLGRTIGFPTVNLDPSFWPDAQKPGVYSSTVKVGKLEYKGALYFGPRLVLNETKNVLEIFIIDFDREIYGETIQFSIGKFVRGPMKFESVEELKKQLKDDVETCAL